MSDRKQLILTLLISTLAWSAFLLGVYLMNKKIDPADRHRDPAEWFDNENQFRTLDK